MQEHMRKPHTEQANHCIYVSDGAHTYLIPETIAQKYLVEDETTRSIPANRVFADLDRAYTEAGALLKGVRSRENMTQVDFAHAIGVTQANLSKMEHGKRPIGKQIAKRIEKTFGVSYKYFLE